MEDYFITGYTGFCPDIPDHIGYNYEKATRKIMQAHPHVRTRLAAVLYPEGQRKDSCYNGKGEYGCYCPVATGYFQGYDGDKEKEIPLIVRKTKKEDSGDHRCLYPVPEYPPGYKGGPMQDIVWRSCYGDGQSYERDSQVPSQPYNLECSEWNSPCNSKHCNEVYQPCVRRLGCNCCNQMAPEMPCAQGFQQKNQELSAPCCDSCVKDSPCCGDNKSEPHACNSAKKGRKSVPGENDWDTLMKKYSGKMYHPCQILEYREGGVVPNYMGHIPGLQNSFGEPYSIAASRLLRKHFDELSRRAP